MTHFNAVEWMRAVRDSKPHKHVLVVAWALALRADEAGASQPSHAQVAADTGLSVGAVRRALDAGQGSLWSRAPRLASNGAQTSNLYHLHPLALAEHPPALSEHPPALSEHLPALEGHPPALGAHPPVTSEHPPALAEHPADATERVSIEPPALAEHPPMLCQSNQQSVVLVSCFSQTEKNNHDDSETRARRAGHLRVVQEASVAGPAPAPRPQAAPEAEQEWVGSLSALWLELDEKAPIHPEALLARYDEATARTALEATLGAHVRSSTAYFSAVARTIEAESTARRVTDDDLRAARAGRDQPRTTPQPQPRTSKRQRAPQPQHTQHAEYTPEQIAWFKARGLA